MASVWGELKRRYVVKVAVGYAIVGWLLIEIASVIGPTLNLPDWITNTEAFFVILGFPSSSGLIPARILPHPEILR